MVALVPVSAPAMPGRNLGDRVLSLLERVDYRRAETAEEKEAIFRLRYQAYLREGAIAPSASERFADDLDETDNAWIFGVYVDGELASSIRLHVASRQSPDLPALNVFSDLLSPEIGAGKTIIDPTRFVADRTASRRFPELCYVTTRLAWLASDYFQTNLLLATVRAEHQAFYRRVFGHRLICEARHYPSLAKPISLMALDFAMARERVPQRYPFFRSTFFERRMLFARTPAVVAAPLRTAA
jgi:N-acyl-L-homoserine lactone synthetase